MPTISTTQDRLDFNFFVMMRLCKQLREKKFLYLHTFLTYSQKVDISMPNGFLFCPRQK